ncbi:hypothetical protein C900_04105 [Fulvivirga imtechensis AK7]|uniref:Uncharacterized protein n=1 Tax=Fulvivirga imtechensis AK7 TaxID=1237149 RepID=L8JPG9_9BACT|nr:hypothetical protein C900_04105 [Fulvivirga imtechensis AK7]
MICYFRQSTKIKYKPAYRSPGFIGGRKVRATQSIVLPNRKVLTAASVTESATENKLPSIAIGGKGEKVR